MFVCVKCSETLCPSIFFLVSIDPFLERKYSMDTLLGFIYCGWWIAPIDY